MIRALPALLVLCALVGCRDADHGRSEATRSAFAGRLEAALALEGGVGRHDALAHVALAAAEAGEGDVVLEAIAAMEPDVSRENLCASCSAVLAKQGRTVMAAEVARQMSPGVHREDVLSRIAYGKGE